MTSRFRTYGMDRNRASSRRGGGAAGLRLRAETAPLLSRLLFTALFLCAGITTSTPARAATPVGTLISNTAAAAYSDGPSSGPVARNSNTITIATVALRTPAVIELLEHAPALPDALGVKIPASAAYSAGGAEGGPFAPVNPPLTLGGAAIDLANPVPLVTTGLYRAGEAVFIRLTDLDQNLDPAVAETVLVSVANDLTGDRELLRFEETGADTGIFAGYIQTAPLPATVGDGGLSVADNSHITASYVDAADSSDRASGQALVNPMGKVFSSTTGLPVDGVSITLIDDATNGPAAVYGDDGVSAFPATIVTGRTATDSSGKAYSSPAGQYRFPYIPAGTYRLAVTSPTGYKAPSAVAAAVLQSLPGGPFAIVEPASRGGAFTVGAGFSARVDIPVDPAGNRLFLVKSANKTTAAIGDFVQYTLAVQNADTTAAVQAVAVNDTLPLGFRYRNGSTKINGGAAADPAVSADGRTLRFRVGDIAAGATTTISYVTEVAAGARPGTAINTAIARGAGASSNPATASVLVKEELLGGRAFVVGRVFTDGCGKRDAVEGGAEGVRLYLEDGTYVVTDENGMYHFEGVTPGSHVVQIDLASVPEKYEVLPCEENSRFAGTAHSQFVDLQGGTLWRADFHLGLKPAMTGEAGLELRSVIKNAEPGGSAIVEFSAPIRIGSVPVRNLRLTVMLPDGAAYRAGTSSLNGVPRPDPSDMDNVLTFGLGDLPGDWEGTVRLTVAVPLAGKAGELATRALLTFDTPVKKNERTPVADNLLVRRSGGERRTGPAPVQSESPAVTSGLGNEKDSSGVKSVATVGLRPGEPWVAPASNKGAADGREMPDYNAAWLETAEPGAAWLWPAEGYHPPIPSMKLAIRHDPRKALKLFLNGTEVDSLYLDGTVKRQDNMVAVGVWRGVHVADGDNLFEAVQYDEAGTETARLKRVIHYSTPPVRAEFVPAQSRLAADGKNPPVIAVRLTDKDGHPAREGVIGEYVLDPPYASRQRAEELRRNPLTAPADDRLKYQVGDDGVALIELQPTMKAGEAVVRLNLVSGPQEVRAWLRPEYRDWVLVGLAEGSAGYNVVTDNMESAAASGADDDLYEKDGRVAFYAKGAIKGEWLLTIAYDSAKKSTGTSGNSLFQTIDPNSFYTLYGDATQQGYDAASAEKLYLKVERDQFYALFGDFNTGLTVTELSRYSRSLTGFKSEYQGKNLEFNVFGSETGQSFVKDEIQGDGTSGLYRLSRGNIVLNSDKITIEVRDRFRSEVILSSRTLARYTDYSIDYDAGTIFFKEPIHNRDENFNPIFIVVDYETRDAGAESLNYGGRVGLKSSDQRIRGGFTHIHEGQLTGEGNSYGVDASWQIDPTTRAKAELARTDSDFGAVAREGNAWLAEIEHRSARLDARAYYRELEEGFGLGQQNVSEAGTRKAGGEATYRLTDSLSLGGQAYRQYNLATGGVRDVVEGKSIYNSGAYGAHLGFRHASDRLGDGSDRNSEQLTMGGSWLTFHKRLTLHAERDQSIGSNANADFPTRTIFGADFKATEKVTLFAAQEFTSGDGADTSNTRAGMKSTPWEGGTVNSSMERSLNENSDRIFALFGLKQTWKVTDKWSVDAGLDRSQTVRKAANYRFNVNVPPASGGGEDFTAVSLGTGYQEKKWNGSARVELRTADNEDKWGFLTSFVGEPREGWGWSVRFQLFDSESAAGDRKTDADLRLGFAHRPRLTRWIVLDRLDLIFDRQEGSASSVESRRIVNNLAVNWKPNRANQLSLHYGAKYVLETIDGADYSGYTDLLGLEWRHDVTKKWDVGLRGSILHSWNAGQASFSAGPSVGYNVVENAWVSLGYNLTGFTDRDFSAADYTAQGPFVRFRFKFDQNSVKEAATWLSRM